MQKSDQNHIDDLFKNHFDSFEAPVVDREGLWRKIVGKDNSRRMFLWLFCSIGVASLAWVVSAEVDFNNKVEKTSIEVANLEAIEVQKSNDERVKTLVSIIEDSKEKDLNELPDEKNKESIESTESVKINGPNVSKDNVNKRVEKSIDQKTIDGKVPSKVEESQDVSQSLQVNVSDVERQSEDDFESFTEVERNQEQKTKEEVVGKFEITKAADEVLFGAGRASERKTSRAISTLENRINEITSTRPGLNDKYNSKLVCATNGSDGLSGHLFFDLYSGVSVSLDQVSLNPGFVDEIAYQTAWVDRYTTLPSLSAGLAVGYETDRGMSLSGGVEYQRLESQYRTTQTVTEIIMVYDPMAYFYYDDNNEIVWVADSVTAVSRYDRTVSLGSKTHLISIPLQLTIPIVSKAGWHIKALVGGAFNFSMTHRGHHLRDDLIVEPITSTNENTYMNQSVGFSIDGGLHIGRYLSEKLELYISPRYRYNRTSYLNSSEHLSLSRDFLGLRVGARYHLD